MNWKIEVKPTAEKSYKKLDKKLRARIKEALLKLEESNSPLLHESVKPLIGELKGDYRLRVGEWRILFTPDRQRKAIYVYAIVPRGGAYKA